MGSPNEDTTCKYSEEMDIFTCKYRFGAFDSKVAVVGKGTDSNQAFNCITSGVRISNKKRNVLSLIKHPISRTTAFCYISNCTYGKTLNLYNYIYAFCLFPGPSNESIK
jgi:hypothetical protein